MRITPFFASALASLLYVVQAAARLAPYMLVSNNKRCSNYEVDAGTSGQLTRTLKWGLTLEACATACADAGPCNLFSYSYCLTPDGGFCSTPAGLDGKSCCLFNAPHACNEEDSFPGFKTYKPQVPAPKPTTTIAPKLTTTRKRKNKIATTPVTVSRFTGVAVDASFWTSNAEVFVQDVDLRKALQAAIAAVAKVPQDMVSILSVKVARRLALDASDVIGQRRLRESLVKVGSVAKSEDPHALAARLANEPKSTFQSSLSSEMSSAGFQGVVRAGKLEAATATYEKSSTGAVFMVSDKVPVPKANTTASEVELAGTLARYPSALLLCIASISHLCGLG